MEPLIIIFVTTSSGEEAGKIAQTLVESHLVACANTIAGIKSTYYWKGEICKDDECLLIMKAPKSNFEVIRDKVRDLHSYDCPEILSVLVQDCDSGYHSWVLDSTSVS